MKSSQILDAFLLFLFSFLCANGVQAQNYTGTFQIETGLVPVVFADSLPKTRSIQELQGLMSQGLQEEGDLTTLEE